MLTPTRQLRHSLATLAVCIGLLLVAGLGLAAPASAHASLLFTTPAAGTAVPSSPTAIVLVFDERITLPPHALSLTTSPAGAIVTVGVPTLSHGGGTLTATLIHALPPGAYTVGWQVISSDGDDLLSSYQFAVGSGATGPLSTGSGTNTTGAQWSIAAARWVQFLALALLLGEAALGAIIRRRRIQPTGRPRSLALPAAAAGLLASLVLTGLIAGNDNLGSALRHPSTSALSSLPGAIAVTESAAFALALAIAVGWRRWAWVPMIAVDAAEALRAHPGDYAGGWGTLLTAVHLAAAAVWVGALIQLVRHVLGARRAGAPVRPIVAGYARVAAWLFALVVLTGTAATLIIVPLHALTTTSYGVTLLIKLAIVLAVAGCALSGRLRLRRREAPRPALIHAEAALLVTVLAVSAALTTTAPPRTVTTALPVAPAAIGPVVYLGNRAGQIGVTVAASAGQVVVRLFAPGADDPDQAAAARYRLATTLAPPGGSAAPLTWRRCGPGCFAARTAWRDGINQLSVHATARGWAGGSITVSVPWPPHPDPAALSRLAQTLRHTGRLTEYERVTSDTTNGPGAVQAISITGQRFLAVEPYSNARATAVDTVTQADGTSTILIAYPDQNIYAELDLDHAERLVHETLTDPNHLITRTFVYPDAG